MPCLREFFPHSDYETIDPPAFSIISPAVFDNLQPFTVIFFFNSPVATIFAPDFASDITPLFFKNFGVTTSPSMQTLFNVNNVTDPALEFGETKPRSFGTFCNACLKPRRARPDLPPERER